MSKLYLSSNLVCMEFLKKEDIFLDDFLNEKETDELLIVNQKTFDVIFHEYDLRKGIKVFPLKSDVVDKEQLIELLKEYKIARTNTEFLQLVRNTDCM